MKLVFTAGPMKHFALTLGGSVPAATALGVAPDRLPSAIHCMDESAGGTPTTVTPAVVAEGDPQRFPEQGDALISRPCLVAGPGGSEWRTRRPSRETQLPRRNQ